MEKNTNKPISEKNSLLKLILFTVIYFVVQAGIYPALAFLFWFIFALFSSAVFLVFPEQISQFFVILSSLISLIILLVIMYFLGYLCKGFLKKMNKKALTWIMIVILIYFVCRTIVEKKDSSIISYLTNGRKYIFCTTSHISFVIGGFFSDKVKKVLGNIKFKRKNK